MAKLREIVKDIQADDGIGINTKSVVRGRPKIKILEFIIGDIRGRGC